jgi:hypothetical protein
MSVEKLWRFSSFACLKAFGGLLAEGRAVHQEQHPPKPASLDQPVHEPDAAVRVLPVPVAIAR